MLPSDDAPNLPNVRLDDRYELLERIGAGGFGEVFRARQTSTGQIVAVKLLRRELLAQTGDPASLLARFRRETHLVARLNHQHIVRLIDAGESEDGRLYAVFEFVVGKTLTAVIAEQGALKSGRAWLLMLQVLEGLASAHSQGIVHRDLKPDNIMLRFTRSGFPHALILDFGVATLKGDARREPGFQTLTAADAMPGTPAYMAPEQVLAPDKVGPWSDVYAWGLIFIECLTGARVVSGDTAGAVMLAQAAPTPIPIPDEVIRSSVGPIIIRSVQKDAEARFPDAGEALAALQPLIPLRSNAFDAVAVSQPTLTPSLAPFWIERPLLWAVVAATSLVIAMTMLVWWIVQPDSDDVEPLTNSAAILTSETTDVVTPASTIHDPPRTLPSPFPLPTTSPSTPPVTSSPTSPPSSSDTCPEGRVFVDGTHCCWPAQRWDTKWQNCVGAPDCPARTLPADERCQPVNQVLWEQHLRCTPQSPDVCFQMGSSLGNPHGGNYMPKLAVHYHGLACEGGFVHGCSVGGALHMGGQDIPINHVQSLKLYTRGCVDLNDAAACYMAGLHHQFGYGTPVRWTAAAPLFERACRHQTTPMASACRVLAEKLLSENKTEDARPYLERCAKDETWCALKLQEGPPP